MTDTYKNISSYTTKKISDIWTHLYTALILIVALAWNEAVKNIRPPTKYALFHRDRATNYRLNNNRYRSEEEKNIILGNIKIYENMYYEEIHSEIHAHIKTGGLNENKIWSKEGLNEAVKIYKEIIQ